MKSHPVKTFSDHGARKTLCLSCLGLLKSSCSSAYVILHIGLSIHMNSKQQFLLLYLDCNLQKLPSRLKISPLGRQLHTEHTPRLSYLHIFLNASLFTSTVWPCNVNTKLISMNIHKAIYGFKLINVQKNALFFQKYICICVKNQNQSFKPSVLLLHTALNEINFSSI